MNPEVSLNILFSQIILQYCAFRYFLKYWYFKCNKNMELHMAKKKSEVYQFKVSLNGSKPLIWRRILVPAKYRFWDLHVAIQDAMGWTDYHLHSFLMKNPKTGENVEIGIPELDDLSEILLTGFNEKIANYFSLENSKAMYEYDFGDSWIHTVKLEKILPATAGEKYPKCIAGKMACPPEDCGGIFGYYRLLEILGNPKHEEHEEMVQWLGNYDPVYFSAEEVIFDDPKIRAERIF